MGSHIRTRRTRGQGLSRAPVTCRQVLGDDRAASPRTHQARRRPGQRLARTLAFRLVSACCRLRASSRTPAARAPTPRRAVKVVHLTTVHRPTDIRILLKEAASLAAEGYAVTLLACAPESFTSLGVRI